MRPNARCARAETSSDGRLEVDVGEGLKLEEELNVFKFEFLKETLAGCSYSAYGDEKGGWILSDFKIRGNPNAEDDMVV